LNTIVGTYECKVDAKGRGITTCASKEANDAFSSRRFCLEAFCFQPCLELYPMDQWNLMMQKINKLNRFVKKIMILFAGSLLV
jgi:MraZ protein